MFHVRFRSLLVCDFQLLLICFTLILSPKATSFGICIGSSGGNITTVFCCFFLLWNKFKLCTQKHEAQFIHRVIKFFPAPLFINNACVICYSVHCWKCSTTTSQTKNFIWREKEFVPEALWALHRGMWERARVKGLCYAPWLTCYLVITGSNKTLLKTKLGEWFGKSGFFFVYDTKPLCFPSPAQTRFSCSKVRETTIL